MQEIPIDGLTDAIKEGLDRKGVLGKIQASLRSEVFQCFQTSLREARHAAAKSEGKSQKQHSNDNVCFPPKPPLQNLVLNELIIEYLEFNGFAHTLSTLRAESSFDHPDSEHGGYRLHRELLRRDLGLSDEDNVTNRSVKYTDGKRIPMLYDIIERVRKYA